MNYAPSNQPLFTLGNIYVMLLEKEERSLALEIHIECWEHEIESEEVKEKIFALKNNAIAYLIREGFINSVAGWMIAVIVVAHPPKSKDNPNEEA